MQNNTSITYIFIILLSYNISIVNAQSNNQSIDVARQINEFIMADEFKSEEREKLRSLPPQSVDILTERLRQLAPGDVGELRVFEFLIVKVTQFKLSLSDEQKSAALSALEAKAMNHGTPYDAYRIQMLDQLKADVFGPQTARRSPSGVDSPQPKNPSNHLKETGTKDEKNNKLPIWPWIIATTGLIASVIFFLKYKPISTNGNPR